MRHEGSETVTPAGSIHSPIPVSSSIRRRFIKAIVITTISRNEHADEGCRWLVSGALTCVVVLSQIERKLGINFLMTEGGAAVLSIHKMSNPRRYGHLVVWWSWREIHSGDEHWWSRQAFVIHLWKYVTSNSLRIQGRKVHYKAIRLGCQRIVSSYRFCARLLLLQYGYKLRKGRISKWRLAFFLHGPPPHA